MATEAVRVVLAKCKRYADYCKSGIEQKEHGLFPRVVWITPDETRKERLRLAIAECRDLSRKQLFLVITPSEFEQLIVDDTESLAEPKGESA
jgi:hypothetical protein